jgi:invasion protein IalB
MRVTLAALIAVVAPVVAQCQAQPDTAQAQRPSQSQPASPPARSEPKALGSFNDWTAFVDGSGAKQVCYIGSKPKKAEGKYTSRGDTYLLVSHRPADKVAGEVSVIAGYTYKDKSTVEVTVDGKKFKLFTQGGNAWAEDVQADKALVQAMRSGKQMVVQGTSNRGTLTTDTYSLIGFSAAFNAIGESCNVR